MGTKLDLHHLHAPPPPARTFASRPANGALPYRRRRVFTVAVTLLVLSLPVVAVLRPVRVVLAGTTAVVPRGTDVAKAATLLKLPAQPGNLVDVTGQVLRPGEGAPPTYV
ncbi:MAG: hypothetical protein WCP21_02605, partial [Armatimonadota bacterium]